MRLWLINGLDFTDEPDALRVDQNGLLPQEKIRIGLDRYTCLGDGQERLGRLGEDMKQIEGALHVYHPVSLHAVHDQIHIILFFRVLYKTGGGRLHRLRRFKGQDDARLWDEGNDRFFQHFGWILKAGYAGISNHDAGITPVIQEIRKTPVSQENPSADGMFMCEYNDLIGNRSVDHIILP